MDAKGSEHANPFYATSGRLATALSESVIIISLCVRTVVAVLLVYFHSKHSHILLYLAQKYVIGALNLSALVC